MSLYHFSHLCRAIVWCLLLSPANAQNPKAVRLSLEDSVRIALGANRPGALLSANAVRVAQDRVIEARSATALLSQVCVADRVFRIDIRSLGIDLPRFSELISSVEFPGARGPYSLLDPRIQATKVLIDKSNKHRVEAARKSVEEARSAASEERENIAAETARTYLEAVRAAEVAELAARNLDMAKTMLEAATETHKIGLGTESDLRHARVAANSEQQTLEAARVDQSRATLRLLYLLGQDFGETLELTTPIVRHDPTVTVEEAVAETLRVNPKLNTLRLAEERLDISDHAVSATWFPTVSTFGDFGLNIVAPNPSNVGALSHAVTYTAGIEVKLPILDGRRRALAHAGVEVQRAEQEIRLRDLRRQLELRVRLAYANLAAASKQADLADANLREAEADINEIEASRAAGNATGLDLRQAQTRQAAAADAKIAAYYGQFQARVALAEATGKVSTLEW